MWEESFRITTKEEITLFRGKKYKDSAKLVDRSTQYEVPAAMDLVVKTASAKFDETVEVHIKLGVDSRHADQQVRGAIVLPNGTGKTRKVLVFAKDAKLDEAKEAGADFAGGMELVEKIQIFDAGKDDRIMELVKLLATDSILKNDPDKEFDELRFAVDDDGTNILVIINKGEITGAVDIDNMYEFASSHCNDFKDLRDDDEIVINREWILNKLTEEEN